MVVGHSITGLMESAAVTVRGNMWLHCGTVWPYYGSVGVCMHFPASWVFSTVSTPSSAQQCHALSPPVFIPLINLLTIRLDSLHTHLVSTLFVNLRFGLLPLHWFTLDFVFPMSMPWSAFEFCKVCLVFGFPLLHCASARPCIVLTLSLWTFCFCCLHYDFL